MPKPKIIPHTELTPSMVNQDDIHQDTKLLLDEEELNYVKKQITLRNTNAKLRKHTKDKTSPLQHSVIFDASGIPYILYSLLGKGSFGKTRLAQSLDGKWHAVKIQKLTDIIQIQQVGHESELLAELGKLIGILSTINKLNIKKHYAIQEYIPGDELFYRLVEKPSKDTPENALIELREVSLKEKLLIATQLMSELSKLHCKGILHCDLKLENVMWDGVNLKIIDFGLSKKLAKNQNEIIDTASGTQTYVAPEISPTFSSLDSKIKLSTPEGGSIYSKASDIFAAGEMLRLIFLVHPTKSLCHTLKNKLQNFIKTMKALYSSERPTTFDAQMFFKEHLLEHISVTEEPLKLNWQIEVLRYKLVKFVQQKEQEIINEKKSKLPNILHFLRINKQQEILIANDIIKSIDKLTNELDLEHDMLQPNDLILFYSHLINKSIQNKILHASAFRFSSGTLGATLTCAIKTIREGLENDLKRHANIISSNHNSH